MYWRFIFHFFILLVLLIIQLSIVSHLPWGLSYLNLLLVVLVFTLLLFDFNWSFGWWLSSAWLLGLFSFGSVIGLIIMSTIIFFLLYWLLNSFFTNRSLYALLFLVGLAILVNDVGGYVLNYLSAQSQQLPMITMQVDWWWLLLQKIGVNLLLTIVLFYAFNFFSQRFRPILNR